MRLTGNSTSSHSTSTYHVIHRTDTFAVKSRTGGAKLTSSTTNNTKAVIATVAERGQ